jgi:hypothetical protein
MTTTTTEREAALQPQELPALTPADRVALSLGAQLILRAERHRVRRVERAARTEHARTAHAEERAESGRRSTFEHRALAGPGW